MDDTRLYEEQEVERSFARSLTIGMLVGMPVGAAIWIGLVAIALVGSSWPLGPAFAMAAAVGVFAGAFFGGWVGTMAKAQALDEVEHRGLRQLSS